MPPSRFVLFTLLAILALTLSSQPQRRHFTVRRFKFGANVTPEPRKESDDGSIENKPRQQNVFVRQTKEEETTTEIPIALALKFNTFTNAQQLLNEIQGGGQNNETMNRLVQEPNIEKKGSSIPMPAACIPELRVVELTKNDRYNYMYYPTCTRIERCGGCCSHDLLACQPMETEIVNFEVVVTQILPGGRPLYKGKDIISVERHLKCRCDCKKKASDCNKLQEYIKGECQCDCTNKDERQKCLDDNTGKKHWDSDACLCKCYNEPECNTGSMFNKNTCSCEVLRSRNKFPGWYDTRTAMTSTSRYGYSLTT